MEFKKTQHVLILRKVVYFYLYFNKIKTIQLAGKYNNCIVFNFGKCFNFNLIYNGNI